MPRKENVRRLALPKDRLMTVRDVAKHLRLHEKTVYNKVAAARSGKDENPIPFHKVGGAVRFVPEELEDWVSRSTAA